MIINFSKIERVIFSNQTRQVPVTELGLSQIRAFSLDNDSGDPTVSVRLVKLWDISFFPRPQTVMSGYVAYL